MSALPIRVPVDEVIRTELLDRRGDAARNLHGEARAYAELQRALAGSPRAILRKLADVALELCRAHSAGVSLLEEEGGRRFFRWHAVAGAFEPLLWTTLPRECSPCGTVLDRNETLLMVEPARHFTPLRAIEPPVVEALLVPFAARGEPVGTVWVISHDAARGFGAEDRRIVTGLTAFAGAAYVRLQSLQADDVRDLSSMYAAAEPADAEGGAKDA